MPRPGTELELTLRGRVVAGLALLAGVAGWLAEDPHARLAAALLLAPLLLDLLAKPRWLHQVSIHLALRHTVVGTPFLERLVLRTPPRWFGVYDLLLLEPRTMKSRGPCCIGHLAAGNTTELLVEGRSDRRGHWLERVFALTTAWPFGLWRARAVVTVPAELVTEPRRVTLRRELLPSWAAQRSGTTESRRGHGQEFHSLREHPFGGDARAVHALRSAALGVLVQRVRAGCEPQRAGLVLDLRRPPGRPLAGGQRRFEWSLGAAATLVEHCRKHGAEVSVLVLDARSEWFLVRSPQDLGTLWVALAEAAPVLHRPLGPEPFAALRQFAACWWVPAGSYLAAAEYAPLANTVQLVDGDFD
jgi:uncharacterized protein (DUF58 family)